MITFSLLLIGCEKNKSVGEHQSVFTVGDVEITESVLDAWYAEKTASGSSISEVEKEKSKHELVELVQLSQLAEKQGLMDSSSYEIELWRLHAKRARVAHFNDKLLLSEPKESELRDIYNSHESFKAAPEKRSFAVLWIPKGVKSDLDQVRAFYLSKKEQFAKKIAFGFGSLAVDNTYHKASRYKGGMMPAYALADVNQVSEEWVSQAIKTSYTLKLGELSPVIEGNDGSKILVLLMNVQKEKGVAFEEVRKELERIWHIEQKKKARATLEETLNEQFPVRGSQ